MLQLDRTILLIVVTVPVRCGIRRRRYIIKFFTIKIGLDYSRQEQIISSKASEKIKIRSKEDTTFAKGLIDVDVEYVDFEELGEIIYQQKTAFNRIDDIFNKIELSSDLSELKKEIQGNYSKYFKDHFEQKDFKALWEKCAKIRNKVAHNYIITEEDLENAKSSVENLEKIITNADKKINEAVFSIVEKEALIKPSIQPLETRNETELVKRTDNQEYEDRISSSYQNSKAINEDELIKELQQEQNNLSKIPYDNPFIGLKKFITKTLADKGFDVHSSYIMINILDDKGMVEIYDHDNPYGDYPTKAIKLLDS
nr:Swt1 family HEPN domain-containing protein [Synechocystis sp. LEGE 06083]